jgi:nucleoid-associated protein YgaU
MGYEKLRIQNKNTQVWIECMFNPTEYSISKSQDWKKAQQTGKDVPKGDSGGGQPRQLTMQLLFDVFEKEGATVAKEIDELWKLVLADREKTPVHNDERERPPLCVLHWGDHWEFTATVTSLKVRYMLFREDGRPARAMVDLTLVEARDDKEQPGTNPTSYAEPGHRRREVIAGDTLPLIAYQEFGDPGVWRRIADANQLDDPLALRPGQVLAIPPAA